MASNRALAACGCDRVLAETEGARVVIADGAVNEFDGLDERKKAQLLRVMELWCAGQRLTPEQFNPNEGRARRGDLNVLVQAFKTHKVRLYGSTFRADGKRTFAIVEIDPAKKQNKADPKVLKRAKERAGDLELKILAQHKG